MISEIQKESVKALKKKKDVIEDRLLFSIVYRNLQQKFINLDFILVNSLWDIFEDIVK
jgi:thymidylate kinase